MTDSHKDLEKENEELKTLILKREKALKEQMMVNSALDKASMYATTDEKGRIIQISSNLKHFLKIKGSQRNVYIQNLVTDNFGAQEKLTVILKKTNSKMWNGEFEIEKKELDSVHIDLSIVPLHKERLKKEFLILFTDISKRIFAQRELAVITKEKFDNAIELQKSKAAQVVNAQEEERKRIARDIHDGIGQMLTALKFNLESISGKSKNSEIDNKIKELQALTFDIIKEVRATTFNLTPPELSDYGVVSGIKKMTTLFARLTEKKIHFVQKDIKVIRFDPQIEINLYRIVQEGLNNAIKYSNASVIVVQISISEQMMSIKIEDNGQGFASATKSSAESEGRLGGNGFENMKERAKFINARLFIRSKMGVGTTITINVPINENIQ